MEATQTTLQSSVTQTSSDMKAELWLLGMAVELIEHIQKDVLPTAPDYVREQFARPSMVRKEIAARIARLARGNA